MLVKWKRGGLAALVVALLMTATAAAAVLDRDSDHEQDATARAAAVDEPATPDVDVEDRPADAGDVEAPERDPADAEGGSDEGEEREPDPEPDPEPDAGDQAPLDVSSAVAWEIAARPAIEAFIAESGGALRGLSVAVASDTMVAAVAVGHSGDRLLDVADRYPVMSVTKSFTAALALREASAGRLDLDASVPAVPGIDVPEHLRSLTPRMLLRHTSGLVNYMQAGGYDPAKDITSHEIVNLSVHSPLLAEPGTAVNYSNTNYHWLGLVLEHVTGRTYADLVSDLAAELGLPDLAVDAPARPGWVGYASGGIRAPASSIARWGAALHDPGRVVDAGAHEQMVDVGLAGAGLGVWGLCPCPTDSATGQPVYTALGQVVATGLWAHYPDGVTVVVRAEPGTGGHEHWLVELAHRLRLLVQG